MLSKRIENMNPSVTVELTAKIEALQRKGREILTFNVGEPDFNTPDNICSAAKKAIDQGFTRYTPVPGILELREAICKKLGDDNNLAYTPDEILVSTGAKQSLINGVLALCDPGDEVMVPTPCWVSYLEMIKLAQSTPVSVGTRKEDGFQLDIEQIKQSLSPRTKAIILNTPNNPTGAVYREETLRELGALAVKHDFYIFADEVYEKLVYTGEKHISIASLSPAIKERTITINGLSKAYAMTGWRLGYAAGPEKIIKAMNSLQGHMTSAPNSITQKTAIEALLGSQEPLTAMREKFDQRRQYIVSRLNKMPGITCADAKGAFYVLPEVSSYYESRYKGKVLKHSADLFEFLLEEANIAVVPGAAFEAPDNLRISYSNSLENIKERMERMEKALGLLKP
ncbi:pyridoxal phosphate-dependent aminotransferase [Isachenkonia alkalipeptolytica]|uniref:Aminotransferase n=1 Tax=Isachenkonia alkalipeptolytica TaxID=2565777 RepID=A0AA43XM15_9CLOT|nr:pyridoxal phosphate-dependent aminotransferase [Isachenkonia alkalipeptolytica]NBG88819.1 pyridoxal phosphate-dependent aminotransferase [Isachenkonia alkalipeptolytica]